MQYIIIVALITLSALFSGLTLGFFSLNKNDLKRKAKLGNRDAKKVYKIRKDGNLLLCTLLIGNVAVNSTLSIFLGSITAGWVAGLVATSLIVILGEIAPQATFARHALFLGSRLSFVVRFFIILLFPICWPLAWILDKILGDEVPNIYSKRELIKIVEEHEDHVQSDIDADEERIIKGALSFSSKTVADVMTPQRDVYMLPDTTTISNKVLRSIHANGHSRIPVYKRSKNQIIGVLFTKDLINPQINGTTIHRITRKPAFFVKNDKPLDEVLNAFARTKNHLFIVRNRQKRVVGILTIEDVLEEIIGQEIIDEFDKEKRIPAQL